MRSSSPRKQVQRYLPLLDKMASEVGGFQTLLMKLNEKCRSCHVLYYKKHTVRREDSNTPPDKTIFAVNIPPYCTKAALKRLFSPCGAVQNVYLQKRPGLVKKEKQKLVRDTTDIQGFKVAYVVFKKSVSVSKAMELDGSKVRLLSDDERPVETGMKKWCQEYITRYPNPVKLQAEVDAFMAKFDEAEEKAKREAKESQGQPDDEGWITVGRGGRKPGVPRVDNNNLEDTGQKKKKKKAMQLDFYNFQQRESRREHIAQLRRKFEDDKKKIAQMKTSRKFRPY